VFVYEFSRWHGAMATRLLREIARKLSFTYRRILAISCVAKKVKDTPLVRLSHIILDKGPLSDCCCMSAIRRRQWSRCSRRWSDVGSETKRNCQPKTCHLIALQVTTASSFVLYPSSQLTIFCRSQNFCELCRITSCSVTLSSWMGF